MQGKEQSLRGERLKLGTSSRSHLKQVCGKKMGIAELKQADITPSSGHCRHRLRPNLGLALSPL